MSRPAFLDEVAATPVNRVRDEPESFERRIACLPVIVAVVDLLYDNRETEETVDLV